ncbi:hypothetical protein BGZ61DRAFT_466344 [Ilyonectria robusta]|uniref:uncharacterized protein n=1 Tax=Ilyonectria robusta TaxID=1079257 RepID=UPI001E8E6883|nr:uncharacterized protein BGZ61DRAFT_466344 [Ilyonectria robusta]KAH8656756.1 hypothetical protein BGZ61DRAFT_466344 [Ilyonectria robusta]
MGKTENNYDPQMPPLPLAEPPECKECGQACKRESRGRRSCWCCYCYLRNNQPVWSTWDDTEGVEPGNPLCDCGYYSRSGTKKTGEPFKSCAVGRCNMSDYKGWSSKKAPGPSYLTPPATPSRYKGPQPTGGIGDSSYISPQEPRRNRSFGNDEPPYTRKDPELIRLLEHVFTIAEKKRFPSQMPNMSDLRNALPAISGSTQAPIPFKIRSSTDFERHSKIGAAGELYVWALISFLLPANGIYVEDWKSNMRNWAKQHPDLAHFPDYVGGETADLDFLDDTGAFTNLLIQSGYLDSGIWRGQKPHYLIEVKSSLSNKNKEFYLSSNQYDRMQENTKPRPSSSKRPTIYMVARVSNLQQHDIDLRFYIDPESMRKEKRLRFRQVWAVEEVEE